MKKSELKKKLLMIIPVGILIGGLLGSFLGTRSALKDTQEELFSTQNTLLSVETQLDNKEELYSDLTQDLLEARNQLFMIDMYNEREFYMNQKDN